MADESWESALKLVQEGKVREAHALFEGIVKSDVHNVPAWFWYAKTSASSSGRTRILRSCLRFNPDNLETRQLLGLAPIPASEPASTPPGPHTGRPLAFDSTGSAAPEADSGESTKPLKAYVPTPTPSNSPAPKQGAFPRWLLLAVALLLLAFLAIVAWIALRFIPSA